MAPFFCVAGVLYHGFTPSLTVLLEARADVFDYVTGASFGFRTVKDSWDYEQHPMRRHLLDVDPLALNIEACARCTRGRGAEG
ncbi:MAG: hypothetical protein O7E57_17710, partial [Gammaproteobacteria bacterium]|nr:hypothetical protein [Gammaproteobacteria bacterium]